MYRNNISIITFVGMRIILRRFAVGCPPGMTDPACTDYCGSVISFFPEKHQPPFSLYDFCGILPVADGHTG